MNTLVIVRFTASPAKSKVTNEQAIMAHIVASITVFVNAPPLYLPRRYAMQTQGLPPIHSFAARVAATGHVFLASSCLTPTAEDLLSSDEDKVDY